MSTKKRTYSARDYEDMVKIELENGIEETKKQINELTQEMRKTCKKPDGVRKILAGELAMRGVAVASDIRVKFALNGRLYDHDLESKTHEGGEPPYNNVVLYLDNSRDIKTDEAKKLPKDVITYFNTAAKFDKKIDPLVARRKMLEDKMENYRSLAARFRLGYTGDPTDLNSINHKCKTFLLGETK